MNTGMQSGRNETTTARRTIRGRGRRGRLLAAVGLFGAGIAVVTTASGAVAAAASAPSQYVAIAPCRLVDTRETESPLGTAARSGCPSWVTAATCLRVPLPGPSS